MRFAPFAALILGLGGCGPKATVVPQPVALEPASVQEVTAKVREYAELRDRVEKQLKPLPDQASPEVISARRTELAAAVQKLRSGAREGDIFTPAVRPYIAKIIASEMRGADGKPVRDAAKQGNPRFDEDTPGPVKIVVNAKYPETEPKSVMPPTLLLRLPKLAEEMQYHFVGQDLVLVDIKTGLVVDVFRRAAPGLAAVRR